MKHRLEETKSLINSVKPKPQKTISESNLNQPVTKANKVALSTSDIINEMFDCDSRPVINDLKGAKLGSERLDGTSDSPNSTSLMVDQVDDDYRNEIFSSGDENSDVQWAKINKRYRANIHEKHKGFTTSDDDNATEDGIDDDVESNQRQR